MSGARAGFSDNVSAALIDPGSSSGAQCLEYSTLSGAEGASSDLHMYLSAMGCDRIVFGISVPVNGVLTSGPIQHMGLVFREMEEEKSAT